MRFTRFCLPLALLLTFPLSACATVDADPYMNWACEDLAAVQSQNIRWQDQVDLYGDRDINELERTNDRSVRRNTAPWDNVPGKDRRLDEAAIRKAYSKKKCSV